MMWESVMLDLSSIWSAEVQQRNFRSLLDAMARPGRVQPLIYDRQESSSIEAIMASILDGEVCLSDHNNLLNEDDWPLLQAQKATSESADYVLCKGSEVPDFTPKLGTLTSPELSALLVIQVDSLSVGDIRFRLRGPGVERFQTCTISGLDRGWLSKRNEWVCAFPLGVDLILLDRSGVLALPRTTRVESC
jgi:alpha-D-ribose 1-methylphosphonate 5-triphosphate synthase subunit PhnH